MPYHIGAKGSNGCSGYPVLSDKGHVAGCHATEAEATAQLGALYANVPDASKTDTPMDVAYNAVVTDPTPANPSSHINPAAGMSKPQYMTNYGRQIGGGIHDKRVVDIWTIKTDTPPIPENPIMPTNTYQGCDCDMCEEQQIPCSSCPMCGGGMDAETERGQTMEQKRDFSSKERQRMAEAGTAMPDGSYPIANRNDLMNAIRSWGRGGSDPKVKEHIKSRARALGLTDMIPENWQKSESFFNFRDIRPTRNTVVVGESNQQSEKDKENN